MRVTSARAALFGTVAAAALYTTPAAAAARSERRHQTRPPPNAQTQDAGRHRRATSTLSLPRAAATSCC